MKITGAAGWITMAFVFSAAQGQSQKSIAEVARANREARLRKAAEDTVNQMCSKADDPKMQQTYPKIQEKCKDKPALIQAAFESALKKQKEAADENTKRPPEEDKSWVGRALAAQTASADSVSGAKYRAEKACGYGALAKPSEVLECAEAEAELENARRTQAATPNQRSSQVFAGPGDYVVSLTGTTGLPVTGTCSFAGKAVSFDDVLPAQHVLTAGRGVLCSFVKKYVQGTLKIQIGQNGAVRDQAETEASYGVVSLSADW